MPNMEGVALLVERYVCSWHFVNVSTDLWSQTVKLWRASIMGYHTMVLFTTDLLVIRLQNMD